VNKNSLFVIKAGKNKRMHVDNQITHDQQCEFQKDKQFVNETASEVFGTIPNFKNQKNKKYKTLYDEENGHVVKNKRTSVSFIKLKRRFFVYHPLIKIF
jgi:hypothetical protein